MLGGIAFAIGLSLIVALLRVVRPHTAELGLVEGTDTFRDIDRNPDAHPIPGLLIYRIDDELFFANAAFFVRDVTAVQQLAELLDELDNADVGVSMARVRQPVREMLERSGILEQLGEDSIFLEVDDAVEAYRGNAD